MGVGGGRLITYGISNCYTNHKLSYQLINWLLIMYLLDLFCVQLMVLDAVPDLDLIAHLPEFLDGLFNIFKDRNAEIRKMLVMQSPCLFNIQI